MFAEIINVCLFLRLVMGAATLQSRDLGAVQLPAPSAYQSPRFRWWWPGGWIQSDEVNREMTAIIDAGFGGGEIGDVEDSIKVQLDPQVYGWAQDRWNLGVAAACEQAERLGGYMDLTLGPHWPTGFPGYTPDSPQTMKELVHGQVFVKSGEAYTGPLPLPVASPSGNETGNPNVVATPRLAAVLAARTNTTDESASAIDFDPATVQAITSTMTNNTISWTAPGDGDYVLVAAYCRGTGQIQNIYDGNPEAPKVTYPFPAYIVDHFSQDGVEAGIQYWDEHVLTNELRSCTAKGSIFEDSLELKVKQYWTLNFLEEFKTRRGYDLTPYLLYVIKDTNTFTGDNDTSEQVLNDFYQTVSDLYTSYRVEGIKTWANGIGMDFRAQPYTASFDSAYAASLLDIPEGESLGFDGDNDAFRVLATGRDIAGRTTVLSDELGAFMGEAYGVTWDFLLSTSNLDMSLGVSQAVIHGFPYQTSPDSRWPGFAPFTPLGTNSNGFADAWGPRQPQWLFAPHASQYLAHAMTLLQGGGPSVDIAILNDAWGVTATWSDDSLNDAGYSYQFPTSELLRRYNVTVEGARLAPEGPQYKALIVKSTAMDVTTAQLLLDYAQDGLPIVIVEPFPDRTFSFSRNATADQEHLEDIFSEVSALSNTRSVSDDASVPHALEALNVKPLARYPDTVNSSLITYRRSLQYGYLYWVYNNGDDSFSGTIQLEGQGYPLEFNLWDATVGPIAAFSSTHDYVNINVTVASSAAAVIYLGSENNYGVSKPDQILTATTCESYVRGGTTFISSNSSCSATTANGTTLTLTPSSLPSSVTPSEWALQVQDWSPAQTNETGLNSPTTIKTNLTQITLTELLPWPNITGLSDASGVGIYTTSVTLTRNDSSTRIWLSIGDVEGSWTVRLNGQNVSGVDWISRTPLDVTELVINGLNQIEITVATTLWNKLRAVWSELYGSLEAQLIGLTGPVVFSYLQEQAV